MMSYKSSMSFENSNIHSQKKRTECYILKWVSGVGGVLAWVGFRCAAGVACWRGWRTGVGCVIGCWPEIGHRVFETSSSCRVK